MTNRTRPVVPTEVYSLIEDEVASFRNFSSGYILENYKYGVSDVVIRFYRGDIQVLGNKDVFNNKHIVNIRGRLLASYLKDAYELYPEFMEDLDLIMPVCLSDTSDVPLQEIPCLVFSKAAFSTNILMPSPNNLIGHWEVDRVRAFDAPLDSKENKMCFVGSLTGSMNSVPDNMRLKVMDKLSQSDNSFCRLLRPPNLDEDVWNNWVGLIKNTFPKIPEDLILNEHIKIDIAEQLKYKYHLCVDGHSCAWARLPWQMSANGIPLKIRNPRHNWKEWFYPLLKPNKHFLEIDIEELDSAYEYLESDPKAQNYINESGKQFVEDYCSPELALDVLVQTLLLLNKKQNNLFHRKAQMEAEGQVMRRV